jgi:enterochelin esterase-like enzyme
MSRPAPIRSTGQLCAHLCCLFLIGLAHSRPPLPFPCDETTGQLVAVLIPSQIYGRPVPANVYLPPCYDGTSRTLPVIYLLHGGGSDETQWPDLGVQREADALLANSRSPFVVIMPGGAYIPGLDYEAFVLKELIPTVEKKFSVKTTPAGRAIGGLSLGGYWALRMAFRHPDQFVAVGGNSPVVQRGDLDDPLRLARTATGLDLLQMALDVGDQDFLRDDAQQLADALQARGLGVSLLVQPGAHNRTYWRAHTGDYLRFYINALNLAPEKTRPAPSPASPCHRRG